MENLIWIPILLVGALAGFFIGYFIRKSVVDKKLKSAEEKANTLLSEAKQKQKELLLEAKDKAIKIIDDAKREESQRRGELKHMQTRLERREETFDKKLLDLEEKQQRILDKAKEVEHIKQKISDIKDEQIKKLEKIAGLTFEEAKNLLLENTEQKMKDEVLARIRKLQEYGTDEIERKTKELMSLAMQRLASSVSMETTTTVVSLPSDEMKGRIIGREGRNIKTIENLTGVEIVVDDTPEAILVSGFNPIRRQLAKITLEKLIADGRIHPGRIEDTVEEAKRELALDIKKAGEEAAYEVGVVGLDPKLVQILGRLKYRTSYGQNVLQHSKEVALISKILAEELGANVSVATKGGLLHDIGKAVDHEVQGTHPQIGYDIMKKYGLPEEVAYMAIAHHEDNPGSLEGIINKVADALSGARPGARKDTYENYLQRLTELEEVAGSFEGIEKVYAIQAGREVRVFVTPDKIDDLAAMKLARDIAGKIEEELKYPGEIKVNVIRENRITEYAR